MLHIDDKQIDATSEAILEVEHATEFEHLTETILVLNVIDAASDDSAGIYLDRDNALELIETLMREFKVGEYADTRPVAALFIWVGDVITGPSKTERWTVTSVNHTGKRSEFGIVAVDDDSATDVLIVETTDLINKVIA